METSQTSQTSQTSSEKVQYLNSLGFSPVSENLAHKLKVVCSKGHTFKRAFGNFKQGTISCPECEKEEKVQYLNSLGFSPISENIGNLLEVQCSKGHTFKRAFADIKRGITGCPECEKEEKLKYLTSLGFYPISENLADSLIVKCNKCNHTFKRAFHTFKVSPDCPICEKHNLLTSLGFKLVSESFGHDMTVMCSKGHIFKRRESVFREGATTCPECDKEERLKYLASVNLKPVSDNLANNLEVQCSKGHSFKRSLSDIKRGITSCPECEKEEKQIKLLQFGLTCVSDHIGMKSSFQCDKGHIFIRNNGAINKGATKCPICYPDASSAEVELRTFLEEHNISAKNDWSILEGKELDLYIPEHSLAIEFNGIYWHSELQGKYKKYHLEKTQKCLEQNISLLHIFENEWKHPTKREIWKSIVLGKLGKHSRIFARKTILKTVSKVEEKAFLEENHLQGSVGSQIALGLYLDEELLCLMSFGKNRMSSDVEWELLRFASKKGISVVGGASKLFKYFLTNFTGGIVSYSDRRYSQGNMYSKLGFQFSHFSEPNYFYFKDPNILESRQKYMKHKLPKLLETFDSSLTEWQNMKNNGFDRIWDCGNSVWKIVR